MPDDCYTIDMIDSFGDGWNGNILDISDFWIFRFIHCACRNKQHRATCCWRYCFCTVLGCTDSGADNYDPNANTDDGSCTYSCAGTFVNINCDGGAW